MEILVYFSGMAVLFILWGGYAFKLKIRKETRERELAHAERMKALELGRPLPDTVNLQAEADMVRMRSGAAVGILVPLCMAAAATGATLLVFHWAEPAIHLALLCVIWGVCGGVSLVAVGYSLAILRRPRLHLSDRRAAPDSGEDQPGNRPGSQADDGRQAVSAAIKEPTPKY
jgi:hypothetical protein